MVLAGMEVPIIGSDSVRWVEVRVPSSNSSSPDSPVFVPLIKDAASLHIIGNPSSYLIWKIRKSLPNALDILEFSASEEFPVVGLRIIFPERLSPFAYICGNEIHSNSVYPYLLYTVSASGVAYRFLLKTMSAYTTTTTFASNELVHYEIQHSPVYGRITASVGTNGCFVVGRDDGSVACFHFGSPGVNSRGFMHELRDDTRFSRFLGFMSRDRIAESVKDLAISFLCGKEVLFVLHADGILRAWDLLGSAKLFSHSVHIRGTRSERLWIAEANPDVDVVHLGVQYEWFPRGSRGEICVYNLSYMQGGRLNLSVNETEHHIELGDKKVVDVRLHSQKIWILKENELLVQDLFSVSIRGSQSYSLQDTFVKEELLLSSEDMFDDLLQITCSIFSIPKAKTCNFVSSIFLRKLFHPGVHNAKVLRAVLEDYNKQWTDADYQALRVDGLKKEIMLLIEHEARSTNVLSLFNCWKDFCSRYFHRWREDNAQFGLLLDPQTGAFGLIREKSVSLFRCLGNVELHVHAATDKWNFGDIELDVLGEAIDENILYEVLRCQITFSQGLCGPISSVFYESFITEPIISSDDILHHLLKILETGPNSAVMALYAPQLDVDFVLQKELKQHRKLRSFSVDMLNSLHCLRKNAGGWARVLDVVESFLKDLAPQTTVQNMGSDMRFLVGTSILVQATSQVAKVMFQSALGLLLLLKYLLNIGGQIDMSSEDLSRVQLELIPMIHEINMEWLMVNFFTTMSSESLAVDDFSSQLSSLSIDSVPGKESWREKLGSMNFVLAFVLLVNCHSFGGSPVDQSSPSIPSPGDCINLVQRFASWIILGGSGDKTKFCECSMELALVLLKHRQYNAVETLLIAVGAHLSKKKSVRTIQSPDGEWCLLYHFLGCCRIAQAQGRLHGPCKEKKVCEAVRCFFRAASGEGASKALQNLPSDASWPQMTFAVSNSTPEWRLHYYQWVTQVFELYNFSEAACQFSFAALEQVDEAVVTNDDGSAGYIDDESAVTVRGRLWTNVFKFSLDLNKYNDAYCAIVTNPDEESKKICLRRFIIVLYERGVTKMLCNGQLPFINLTEKIERELAWKAAHSDISEKPNPYKLLYAFEIHQQNWRKAANYIYLHAVRLKAESSMRNHPNSCHTLQERINSISAAINTLYLVDPAYSWIDLQGGGNHIHKELNPSIKPRIAAEDSSSIQGRTSRHTFVDIAKLEDEFVLTTAEYMLALANVNWAYDGSEKSPSGLVDLLIDSDLYDMAFTVLLRFWEGSALQRELERVFSYISLKCCTTDAGCTLTRPHGHLLTLSDGEPMVKGELDADINAKQSKRSGHWDILKQYLEMYQIFHPRLPIAVAEMLLRSDPQIELPLWIVRMLKGGRKERNWGMTGQESDPASLFRLYVNYGRLADATDMLVEYIDEHASVRPAEIIHRKMPFSAWFPYTAVEQLWCQLDESIRLDHMVEQCKKLKTRLHGALRDHLILLKGDSEDAVAQNDVQCASYL